MSDNMKELLKDSNHTEPIARTWPIIKEILVEQQLITAADGDGDLLKGFAIAYRCLENFKKAGDESIEKKKKQKES